MKWASFRANEWERLCPSLPVPPFHGMLDIPSLSGSVVLVNWIFFLLGSGGSQSLDQVEFVALFAGKDRRLFVVFHQLLHCVKLALSDAVQAVFQLDFEMLVFGLSFQWYWKVIGLEKQNIKTKGKIVNSDQLLKAVISVINSVPKHNELLRQLVWSKVASSPTSS